jgi:hypothetical protein
MSTINTENLTLYANPYLYNGSRYVFYQTGRDYEAWLRETSSQVTTKTVYFKSLTEEMELNSPPGDILKYPYGKITNDNKSYYIFIDRITTDEHGKSYIKFSVDWWATEWANIHPTKAHLTRKPTKPGYMAQPWTPLNTSVDLESLTDDFLIAATYIPSIGTTESQENSPSYISYILMEGSTENVQKVSQGIWYKQLGLAGSDIKDCFIVPFFTLQDLMGEEEVPPLFIVSIDRIDDHVHQVGWFGGPIMNAWHEKYPCLDSSISQPKDDPTLFTGDELLYNEYTGRWYKAEYVGWGGTPGFPDAYFWEWVEISHASLNRYPVMRYYTQ